MSINKESCDLLSVPGIGKPLVDCDTMHRYKEPPCGPYQTKGGHIWVSLIVQKATEFIDHVHTEVLKSLNTFSLGLLSNRGH